MAVRSLLRSLPTARAATDDGLERPSPPVRPAPRPPDGLLYLTETSYPMTRAKNAAGHYAG